jgi:hypothetical protein
MRNNPTARVSGAMLFAFENHIFGALVGAKAQINRVTHLT